MSDILLSIASDPRVAFKIGSLEVRWYGLIIVTAMLLALIYACLQAKKIGLKADDVVELFLWIIPIAIIFARIFYIFPGRIDEYFPWNSWDDFVDAIAIWDGGITIIGGILGGIIGGIFFTLRHKKQTNFLKTADLVAVPLIMAQVMGRLGNFVNQEAFGLPITDPRFQTFPFGVYITNPSGVSDKFQALVAENTPGWFCATFFYEQVWNLIGGIMMFIFWQKGRNKKYPGLMIMFYLFWYFLGRLWLEFLRIDAVDVTKVACGVVIPIALLLGTLYVIYCNSRQSYAYLQGLIAEEMEKQRKSKTYLDQVAEALRENLIAEGKLEGAPLTQFDIKNYIFIGKVLASGKNPLKILYRKGEYSAVDFEALDYYHVPTHYRSRMKRIRKTCAYSPEEIR